MLIFMAPREFTLEKELATARPPQQNREELCNQLLLCFFDEKKQSIFLCNPSFVFLSFTQQHSADAFENQGFH